MNAMFLFAAIFFRLLLQVDKIWNQEVVDAEGRRRFHGAFTGGYSAGYYNSVGSAEVRNVPPSPSADRPEVSGWSR